MDEFKHADYAEEGWRRVDEHLRREENNLCAHPKQPLVLPAAEQRGNLQE